MAQNEDTFFVEFSLVKLSVKPLKMVMRIIEVQQQPKVEVVAKVGID